MPDFATGFETEMMHLILIAALAPNEAEKGSEERRNCGNL